MLLSALSTPYWLAQLAESIYHICSPLFPDQLHLLPSRPPPRLERVRGGHVSKDLVPDTLERSSLHPDHYLIPLTTTNNSLRCPPPQPPPPTPPAPSPAPSQPPPSPVRAPASAGDPRNSPCPTAPKSWWHCPRTRTSSAGSTTTAAATTTTRRIRHARRRRSRSWSTARSSTLRSSARRGSTPSGGGRACGGGRSAGNV